MAQSFSWKIGGPAGYGIKATGQIFAKSLLRAGYRVFVYYEYPSLVRGGHNTCYVEVADQVIGSYSEKVDLLVVLDVHTLKMDLRYLEKRGCFIYDENLQKRIPKSVQNKGISVPLTRIARALGKDIMRNSVALGASGAVMGLDEKIFDSVLKEVYADLDRKMVQANQKAIKKGFDAVRGSKDKKTKSFFSQIRRHKKVKRSYFITGNEAMALGAIAGQCHYFSAYPMTPATYILHYLHKKSRETQMIVHQAEDEIAACVSAIGASFAGSRSMTATSGGGFALMNEALALAGMTEIGIVLVDVMRPGPATGLPTWTEQGDLSFVLGAGQGDFPKAVLAPGDPQEIYTLTVQALNWADQYQMPVIILSDKFLGESFYTWEDPDLKVRIERGFLLNYVSKDYERYRPTQSGISARTVPGVKNGMFLANSDEHDPKGYSVEGYDSDRMIQMDKRLRKMIELEKQVPLPVLYGPKQAPLTLVGWGSSKGPIMDALREWNKKNKQKVNYLHFSYLFPLPRKKVRTLFGKFKNTLSVEGNATGQFAGYLFQETGIEMKHCLLRYDGKPFSARQITERIAEIFSK